MADEEFARAVRDDLDRRLGELEAAPGAFGEIGPLEWALAAAGFVLLPLAVVWALA